MQNLAGKPREQANETVLEELRQAGVFAYPVTLISGHEVDASVVGVLTFLSCFFGLQRAWYYWVVKATKPFPLKDILRFNAVWGDDARIWGYAGGRGNVQVEEDHLNGNLGCLQSWHIDTQEALNAFVSFAREVYGEEVKAGLELVSFAMKHDELLSGAEILVPKESV